MFKSNTKFAGIDVLHAVHLDNSFVYVDVKLP